MAHKLHADRRTAWGNSVERIFHGNDNWQSVADARRKFARRHALCRISTGHPSRFRSRLRIQNVYDVRWNLYTNIDYAKKEYYSNFSYLKWDLKRVTFVYLFKVCILKCFHLSDIERSNLNFSQYFLTLYKFFIVLSQNRLKKSFNPIFLIVKYI